MNIGSAIRKTRKQRGLKQYELAQAIGTSQAALSFLEKGKASPRKETLSKICSVLDVSETFLYVMSIDGNHLDEHKKELFDRALDLMLVILKEEQ